jgi:hypothetical protein
MALQLSDLNWFYEKVKIKVDKRKRGEKRYQQVNDGEISFPYSEAHFRGLTDQQFSKALKELHARGFIDIKKPGSGLMGDYTVFTISQRWKEFGRPNFKYVEFPKSNYFGYRRMKKKKINDGNSLLANDGISPLETPANDEHSMFKKQVLSNPQR